MSGLTRTRAPKTIAVIVSGFLLSSCLPRLFNDSGQSQLKESTLPESFSEWFNKLPQGPIPNYELVARISFHKVGSELLPDFASRAIPEAKMEKRVEYSMTGGNKGSTDGGVSMVWMRDYAPIAIKSADPRAGGKTRLISYLSINKARNNFNGSISDSRDQELLNAKLVKIDNEVIGAQSETISVLPMPILMEGGNLIATGDHLILTEHIFEQNSPNYARFLNQSGQKYSAESLEKIYGDNGFYSPNPLGDKFEYRLPDEVKAMLGKYLDVKPENIITLPSLPGEGTRHIDLFVLALGKLHLMVPEITDEGIATLAFENEKILARKARDFLNEQATQLAQQYGYRVDRLTMLPPIYQVDQGGEKQAVYISPANALLANLGTQRKKVFLPHFEVPSDWGEPFKQYALQVEERWHAYFFDLGWDPQFVTANEAARSYGLIRCMTASFPFLSERQMTRYKKLGY
ncbi:MAG: Porphyromonas-type peptidyl-arginine deiminase [Pseudomonadota bacterium]|jgi:hypothetical protein